MKGRIDELEKAFVAAKSDKERDAIDREMRRLVDEDPNEFAEAMLASAKDTAFKANELVMRQKLQDVIPAISLVYIAKTYFNKTDAWLYQRINGNIVNGKPARFTPEEVDTLKFALEDLSKKMKSISASL
jgi:hypothetical protein